MAEDFWASLDQPQPQQQQGDFWSGLDNPLQQQQALPPQEEPSILNQAISSGARKAGEDFTAGTQAMSEAGGRLLSSHTPFIFNPAIYKMGLGALQAGPGAISSGIGEFGGELTRKITEPLGPNVSAGLGTAANMALQFLGLPKLAGKVSQTVVKGLQGGLRFVPGVRAVEKQPIIAQAEQLPAKFMPTVGSKELYNDLAGVDNTLVKFPTVQKTAKELEQAESTIMPGLQSPKIKQGAIGAEEALSSGQPAKVVPGRTETSSIADEFGRPITKDIPEKIIPAIPDKGVPFKVGQDNLRRLGLRIRQAESGITDEDAGALRKLRGAFMTDMEKAGEQFPKLQAANRTFMQEQAVADLQSLVSNNIKSVPGKTDIMDIDAAGILTRLRRLTSPNSDKYDKLFTQGLGEKNLAEITKFLNEVNDFGRVSFNLPGPASLISQGILAGVGATAGGAVAGPVGSAIGAVGAASLPHILSEALTKPAARAFILRSLKAGRGNIKNPTQFLAILNALTRRQPTPNS